MAYGCRVNRGVIDFELGKLTEEQLKCLIFVCGLKEAKDVEIRQRLLTQINERPDTTLEHLVAECQRIINLRHDSAMIERESTEQVYTVQQKNQNYHRPHQGSSKGFTPSKNPSTPCWLCGALHWSRDCTYRTHQCTNATKLGTKKAIVRQSVDQYAKRTESNSNGGKLTQKQSQLM